MNVYANDARARLRMALQDLQTAAGEANEAEIRYLFARSHLASAEDHALLVNPPDGKNCEIRTAQLHSRTMAERDALVAAESKFHVARRHYEVAREAVKVACALAGLATQD
jgi:hypothetical protein